MLYQDQRKFHKVLHTLIMLKEFWVFLETSNVHYTTVKARSIIEVHSGLKAFKTQRTLHVIKSHCINGEHSGLKVLKAQSSTYIIRGQNTLYQSSIFWTKSTQVTTYSVSTRYIDEILFHAEQVLQENFEERIQVTLMIKGTTFEEKCQRTLYDVQLM